MSRSFFALLLVALPAMALAAGGYDYKQLAQDWNSMHCTWCGSTEQTPIDLMATSEMGQYVQMPMEFAPTFDLPTVSQASASNNGHNVNLEFATAPGITLRFPAGSSFTSLNGAYTGTGLADDGTCEEPSLPSKNEYPAADVESATPEEVQGTLLDLHWHVPSEHTVNGKLYAAEGHFVHYVQRADDPDCTYGTDGDLCLAVVGVLYDLVIDSAKTDPGFTSVMDQLMTLPAHGESDTPANATFDFNKFLPTGKDFFHYRGSLTTPGCNENVTWFVMQDPVPIGYSQWAKLHDAIIYDNLGTTNARPPLPLNDRTVKVSNYEAMLNDPCIEKGTGESDSAATLPVATLISAVVTLLAVLLQ
mmetsp:Transcript_1296/g.3721  ORF Transcript_1296/g.3721 Transcript_1296/m.3721 type:complete len:361 (-) Transcript_1296:280-1362(-)|eukprot:CAMPEP_0117662762 /NCGR_PEP_ID=MMETSP0804-20121206/8223_1 /TAXON_ID=1074897 /ORGANISM="Tetraselmis astigmatica, Strain CCMP880" /LENGTH=360 /DNA_ID=CAMNT_0005469677 /DNA_START=63 /DNA_END=1145 /DNA_ORIENTATION=+